MPDSYATGLDAPASPLDAQVLEDAADWLLINGRCRDHLIDEATGAGCLIQAIGMAANAGETADGFRRERSAFRVLQGAINARKGTGVVRWNEQTVDDFEVIDTLRLIAKDIRNAEQA